METSQEKPPTGLFLYLVLLNIVVLSIHLFSLHNPPGDIEPPRFFAIIQRQASRFERYKSYRTIKKVLQDVSVMLESASTWVNSICDKPTTECLPEAGSGEGEVVNSLEGGDILEPSTASDTKSTNNNAGTKQIITADTSECCSGLNKVSAAFNRSFGTASDLVNGFNANVIPAVENVTDQLAESIRLEKHLDEYTSNVVGALESSICPAIDRAQEIVTKVSRPSSGTNQTTAFFSTVQVPHVENDSEHLARYLNEQIWRTMEKNVKLNTKDTTVRGDGRKLSTTSRYLENHPISTKYPSNLETSHLKAQANLQKMMEIHRLLNESLSNQGPLDRISIHSDDIKYLLSPGEASQFDEQLSARHLLKAFQDSMAQLRSSSSNLAEPDQTLTADSTATKNARESVSRKPTNEVERRKKSIERLCSLIVKTFGLWNKMKILGPSTTAGFTPMSGERRNLGPPTPQTKDRSDDLEVDLGSNSSSLENLDDFIAATQPESEMSQNEVSLSSAPEKVPKIYHSLLEEIVVNGDTRDDDGRTLKNDHFTPNDSTIPLPGTKSSESMPCSVSSNDDVFYECKATGTFQQATEFQQPSTQYMEALDPKIPYVKSDDGLRVVSVSRSAPGSSKVATSALEVDITQLADLNSMKTAKNSRSEDKVLLKKSSGDITTSASYVTTIDDDPSDWDDLH